MTVSSKIRIYDLAKELKLDTKRLIEEVRREGVDVSVPSNSVSKELAEKIRNKYFPKKETAVKRGVRVVKRAERAVEEPPVDVAEVAAEAAPVAEIAPETLQPESAAPTPTTEAKPASTARLLRKLPPAARAEPPALSPEPALVAEDAVESEPTEDAIIEPPAPETNEPFAPAGPVGVAAPPSRQVRVLRPTVAALNAGIRPGERAPSPIVAPPVTPRDRADRRPETITSHANARWSQDRRQGRTVR